MRICCLFGWHDYRTPKGLSSQSQGKTCRICGAANPKLTLADAPEPRITISYNAVTTASDPIYSMNLDAGTISNDSATVVSQRRRDIAADRGQRLKKIMEYIDGLSCSEPHISGLMSVFKLKIKEIMEEDIQQGPTNAERYVMEQMQQIQKMQQVGSSAIQQASSILGKSATMIVLDDILGAKT